MLMKFMRIKRAELYLLYISYVHERDSSAISFLFLSPLPLCTRWKGRERERHCIYQHTFLLIMIFSPLFFSCATISRGMEQDKIKDNIKTFIWREIGETPASASGSNTRSYGMSAFIDSCGHVAHNSLSYFPSPSLGIELHHLLSRVHPRIPWHLPWQYHSGKTKDGYRVSTRTSFHPSIPPRSSPLSIYREDEEEGEDDTGSFAETIYSSRFFFLDSFFGIISWKVIKNAVERS